jgi:hypothetical protein
MKRLKIGAQPLLLVGLLVAFVGFSLLSAIRDAQRMADQNACIRNLKAIALGVLNYQHDTDGESRSNLVALLPLITSGETNGPQPRSFVCPATRHNPGPMSKVDQWTDYAFIPPPSMRGGHYDQERALACCIPELWLRTPHNHAAPDPQPRPGIASAVKRLPSCEFQRSRQ